MRYLEQVKHSDFSKRNWLFNSLKGISKNDFILLEPELRKFLKEDLGLDSAEISSKLYKLKHSLFN